MLRIAGNTAGPMGQKFCVGTHGRLGGLKIKKKFGKKISAQSVQLFGQLFATYIYAALFYYIDY